jgi:Membrane protein involved in the export of O-antigen and teichoic acid
MPVYFYVFIAILIATLILIWPATLLWKRFYRDDSDNPLKRIFKNSAVPLVLRLFVRGLDLIFAVILYGILAPASIGRYELAALLVVQYLGTITEFGLGVLLTREVAHDREAAPRLFGTSLMLRLILVLCSVPVAGLLIGSYALLEAFNLGEAITPDGQMAIWILMLTLVPAAYSSAVTALYNANEQMEVPALMELVTAIINMLTRIAVLMLGFGILGLSWAAVGVTSFTALVYYFLQRRSFFTPTLRWDPAAMRALLPIAFPLMLNNLLSAVFFRFDTFLLKGLGAGDGDVLVTQYNLAYKVLSIPLILPPVITFAVFPLLARQAHGDRQVMARAQNNTLRILLLIAFPISMALTMLAPDLVRFFTRKEVASYLPIAAYALAILGWFLPLSFVNGLLQYVLIALNQQRSITKAFIIGALFNFLCNLVLIPFFGIYAASLVTIASEVVLLAVFWPLLREADLRPPLLQMIWRPLLASLLMGAAMYGVSFLWGGLSFTELQINWWQLIAMVVVGVPVYVAALWLIGGISAEDRLLLGRVFKRRSA